ncbi:TetR family transcriptional regulator [Mesorhizobium sp. M2A.F.Ca.ET.037.01.1.1]|uniref:TetR/AcrR family transcriptional regulator n=3 Tax=Mesorhizobium TaxID=68287 RepID=UPI000F75BD59|nr:MULTISPECIES: TetR/AcrR family transcriptional regulator [unclassified Mesorhizobium]RUY09305.1 TetR family transcriptional regulator [Mesorhizobium sp. M2A.F.Ca.ET.040.01.1.1]RVC70825.1 TetR family transcriptional regulator [Mesorhizobium sp. M00.F.Ca.ET.038.03.1.1]RVC81500.1 TetR family transcriptional regulator [Mesorhizobium sp. M2A.F.Ca.ET.046.02.1.1]AZO35499.1 TetR/AcrR family transcriptional regulator [Mesorhizobium sp. M2A.F.Ca.ET.046.03.2.1]RUX16877.1 TetR family transcriptional re
MDRPSNTADDILAAARRFIVAGGYNGFSYADIAEVVGIRKASIHHHFPSKVDLVQTLVRRYLEDAVTGMTELERNVPEPPELLRTYAGFWAQCIEDASRPFCVCALLASELPVLPPEVAAEVRAYFRFLSGWLTGVIERGAEQGTLTIAAAPRVEAEAFMATVHGAMLSARAYGDVLTFGMILAPTLQKLIPEAD